LNETSLRGAVAAVSVLLFGFLLWLLYGRPVAPSSAGAGLALDLPAWNAAFNALCVTCLLLGYRAIRRGQRRAHIRWMLGGLCFSALFLLGYITHHSLHGDTPFQGQGVVRPVYFAILISHIVATAAVLPMILFTLARAAAGRFPEHKAIARLTLPLWLYVSATGVLIFAFLRVWS
jgi:putative membrane protein